jgi:Zn-dependent hydrolases, including glyoxylases
MARKSFVTTMPDKAGAFLRASEIIAGHDGNIVRVSYNKAVDPHMLFIDIEADPGRLLEITRDLLRIGYINDRITETRVIEVEVRIPDHPGAVLPVLKILNRHAINIPYLNSSAGGAAAGNSPASDAPASGEPYQNFKFGLLIEDPRIVKTLLDEVSALYPINIIDCDSSEENLDNTVFYIRLANEMQTLLGLSAGKTMQFIAESNRILQALQAGGENAGKVFDYIRRFAYFISGSRGENFKADIEKLEISDTATLFSIQPLCGSNTYVFDCGDELVFIDSGYAIYADEMRQLFHALFPGYTARKKRVYITHADVDHCGLLSKFENAEIIVNKKSANGLRRQYLGLPDYRESTELTLGYSKISRIISGYTPPDPASFTIFDSGTPESHDDLARIGGTDIAGLAFDIYEGSGGHVYGELVYVCEKAGLVFTGDILVNISGFSKERAEFNALAPYLMRSVNVDSKKATEMRRQVTAVVDGISKKNQKPCVICGGHGPLSILADSKPIRLNG